MNLIYLFGSIVVIFSNIPDDPMSLKKPAEEHVTVEDVLADNIVREEVSGEGNSIEDEVSFMHIFLGYFL